MPPRHAGASVPASTTGKKQAKSTNATDTTSTPAKILRSTYGTVTAGENQSIVKAVAMFGVSPYISPKQCLSISLCVGPNKLITRFHRLESHFWQAIGPSTWFHPAESTSICYHETQLLTKSVAVQVQTMIWNARVYQGLQDEGYHQKSSLSSLRTRMRTKMVANHVESVMQISL